MTEQLTEQVREEMRELFLSKDTEAFYMNHYELNKTFPNYATDQWKAFLVDPEIADWLNSEQILMQKSQLQKLLRDIEKSNSTGKAQLIGQLQKLLSETQVKEGPIFVYSYVPLSDQQQQAENTIQENTDLFADKTILQNFRKE